MPRPLMGETVELGPFLHQVGGHCGLFEFNETTVCKPVGQRELSFYESMPEQLKQFCPEFRGTVEVECVKDSGGYVSIIAHPTPSLNTLLPTPPTAKLRVRSSGGVDLELTTTLTQATEPQDATCSSSHNASVAPNNPWSLLIHKRQLAKMKQEKQRFILLENLICQYNYPCILDLKMGTRSFGDHFSESKRERHISKSAITTTKTLGLRVCGMQVYHTSTGTFQHVDKYKGRELDADGVRQCLHRFLHNGSHLRLDAVSRILGQLLELHDMLSQLLTFRFYSSSLLIMYDGLVASEGIMNGDDSSSDTSIGVMDGAEVESHRNSSAVPQDGAVDVRMIDFAQSTFEGFNSDVVVHEGPDRGYLQGLHNLIGMFQDLLDQYHPTDV